MVRRKVPHHAPQAASSTAHSPTTKDHVFTRDYSNRRYKEMDKKRRCTGVYEDSTESQMNRMEGLWREYVKRPSLHALQVHLLISESLQVLQGGEHRPLPYT